MRTETHNCADVPKGGIQIYRNTSGEGRSGKSWVMSILREASEEDLEENHFLARIGDSIWETRVSVKYCPYCGVRLPDADEQEDAGSTWFEHYDMSGWSAKIQ